MAKICDVVKLKTGYANFVELKSAFEEAQENADRMAMYRPTRAHRRAFERLCQGLYQPNDKKFYLLSGSYGTGKSHLCLMFANFLSRSSGDPEIKGFYENYEKLDPEKTKTLRNIRKDGQYLVAICDYHAGRRFEDVVLKAIFEACRAKGLDAEVETEFDEAERLLADWEARASGDKGKMIRDFYEDFGKALEKVAPSVPTKQLRTGLKDYESRMLELFREAFKETMGGTEFQAKSGNLIPIVKKLINNKGFKERFKGLAVFFDEFGFTLEKASYSKDILQGFMETICKNEPTVLFVGCIHKDFKAYADRFSQADAAVMSARITHVDLLNEGIEEIIGAIVETDKDSGVWEGEIQPKTGVFDMLVPVCKSLNLFPWIEDVDRIRQRVLEDIYGVHPIALACLLRLSSEIGSDARSTFTFFSGDVERTEGSYPIFIEDAEITAEGGKLNLYRVDRLFTFFKRELSPKNPELRDRQRQLVNGFIASLETLRKTAQRELFEGLSDERVAILRTILLFHLCQIPTNLENIQFGFYCLTAAEGKEIERRLNHLVKAGALFFRQQSKTYELALGTGEDPYDLIERYLNDVSLHPDEPIKAFLETAGIQSELEFLEAKQYNLHFNEDKRLKWYFVKAKDLGEDLWERLEKEWQESANKEKKGYEGMAVYALCEDETELQLARNTVGTITSERITVAVPQAPHPFMDTLLRVKACQHYLPPNEAEKISAQTESRLRDLLENHEDGYLPQLQRILQTILSGEAACWYGKDRKVVVDRPKQPHKPGDVICEENYKKRCRIKHPDLNFIHDDKWRKGTNTALKQAVAVLLEADTVMIDNGNPDNHGQKRYLEKVLLKGAGALKKTGADGPVSYFQCENDPEKISEDFPVLKALCQRLSELAPGSTFQVSAFVENGRSAPYGAGGTALVLAIAHIIRACGERLRIYGDSTKTVEQPIRSYDEIVELVGNPAAKTIFEIRDITSAQAKLVEGIARAVHAPPLKHGESRSLKTTHDTATRWWTDLNPVAKVMELYEPEQQKQLKALKETMDIAGNMDRFEVLLEAIPSVYTGEPAGADLQDQEALKIVEAFETDVKLFESGVYLVRTSVAEAISEVFGSKGDLIHCEGVVIKWYENLNPNQRDPYKCDDDDAQALLKRLSESSTSFEEKILGRLPQDYGFGSVYEWDSIQTANYAARIKQAKARIEEAKITVPTPQVEPKPYVIEEGSKFEVSIAEGATEIIYTTTGEDPRKIDNAKRVTGTINLAEELGDKPRVTISMRSLDSEGNASEMVTIELVNKTKEYEVQIDKDLFGEKGIFKFPKNAQGLSTVIKSLLQHGIRRGFVEKEKATQIYSVIKELLSKKS